MILQKKTLSFKTLRVESLLNALLVYLEIEKKRKKETRNKDW